VLTYPSPFSTISFFSLDRLPYESAVLVRRWCFVEPYVNHIIALPIRLDVNSRVYFASTLTTSHYCRCCREIDSRCDRDRSFSQLHGDQVVMLSYCGVCNMVRRLLRQVCTTALPNVLAVTLAQHTHLLAQSTPDKCYFNLDVFSSTTSTQLSTTAPTILLVPVLSLPTPASSSSSMVTVMAIVSYLCLCELCWNVE
jgi:hypothetical protein